MQDDLLLRYPHVNRKIFPLTPKSTRCSSIKSEFASSKALLGPGTKQHSYRRGECIAPVNNGVCLRCGKNIYNVDEFVLKLIQKDGTLQHFTEAWCKKYWYEFVGARLKNRYNETCSPPLRYIPILDTCCKAVGGDHQGLSEDTGQSMWCHQPLGLLLCRKQEHDENQPWLLVPLFPYLSLAGMLISLKHSVFSERRALLVHMKKD